jgi:uncharacterized protein (DUF1810 family)
VADIFDLQRFVDAQAPVYAEVCSELRNGRKASHWMWFVFPQLKGLGRSAMADQYAITSRQEAEAYAKHAVLGPRLRECTGLVNAVEDCSIRHILGTPDDLKFRSSMTLFAQVCNDKQPFVDAINKYFDGNFDSLTIERL